LALTGSEPSSSLAARTRLVSRWSSLIARLGPAEHLLVQRLAGAVFLIRVAGALLAYVSQVLLARWMGSFEFGVYVYVWTWVLLYAQLADLGLASAAQRFIPEYRERGRPDLLRGYLAGSRWLAFGIAAGIAAVSAAGVRLLEPWLDDYLVIPLYLACVTLPAHALAGTQDGISRSFDWVGLSFVPNYIVRPLLLVVLMAGAYAAGMPPDAATAMIAAVLSTWLPTVAQTIGLNRRLHQRIAPGAKAHEPKLWLGVAFPILLVESFYSLLTYADVLMLQQYRPPDEVAIYYAAAKTLVLISFVYYAVSATTAHRFSDYHIAGDHDGLRSFVAQSIKWTFWPSGAATALLLVFGRPLLSLFGAQFSDGYPLMSILAFGLLARAAVGPVERLLNMLGEQRVCALVYANAFLANVALCVLLIPRFGMAGAAMANAAALTFESILLFVVTKSKLGLHVFIWRGRSS
jgi:O-antigen/teichoic acid export membrane protein